MDRVHTHIGLSLSQVEEKLTWMKEMTTRRRFSRPELWEQLTLLVIVNLGEYGLFVESEKRHKFKFDNAKE